MCLRRLVGNQRGLGLIEVAVVLVVVAVAGALLYKYMGSTAKTMEKFQEERPLAHARLAADRATLAAINHPVVAHGQLRPELLEQSHLPVSGRDPLDRLDLATTPRPARCG